MKISAYECSATLFRVADNECRATLSGSPTPASAHVGVNRDRLARLHVDVELDRLTARRANLDFVHAGFEVQMLDRAVEVLGHTNVVAVREHLRVTPRALD